MYRYRALLLSLLITTGCARDDGSWPDAVPPPSVPGPCVMQPSASERLLAQACTTMPAIARTGACPRRNLSLQERVNNGCIALPVIAQGAPLKTARELVLHGGETTFERRTLKRIPAGTPERAPDAKETYEVFAFAGLDHREMAAKLGLSTPLDMQIYASPVEPLGELEVVLRLAQQAGFSEFYLVGYGPRRPGQSLDWSLRQLRFVAPAKPTEGQPILIVPTDKPVSRLATELDAMYGQCLANLDCKIERFAPIVVFGPAGSEVKHDTYRYRPPEGFAADLFIEELETLEPRRRAGTSAEGHVVSDTQQSDLYKMLTTRERSNTEPRSRTAVPQSQLTLGEVSFDGGAVPPSVMRTIERNHGQFRYCHESALRRDPTTTGLVVLQIQSKIGRVVDVEIVTNTTGNDDVAQCCKTKVQRWTFPLDRSGTISLPVTFAQ